MIFLSRWKNIFARNDRGTKRRVVEETNLTSRFESREYFEKELKSSRKSFSAKIFLAARRSLINSLIRSTKLISQKVFFSCCFSYQQLRIHNNKLRSLGARVFLESFFMPFLRLYLRDFFAAFIAVLFGYVDVFGCPLLTSALLFSRFDYNVLCTSSRRSTSQVLSLWCNATEKKVSSQRQRFLVNSISRTFMDLSSFLVARASASENFCNPIENRATSALNQLLASRLSGYNKSSN